MLAFVCSTLEMKLSVEGFSEIWGSFPSEVSDKRKKT